MLKMKNRLPSINDKSVTEKQFFMLYSLLFGIIAFAVFFNYFNSGVSFIREGDGYSQHYTCLEYYGKWLRSIICTLFTEHKLVIPNWDFSIGMGSDVVTTFNYYIIGDPLTLTSVFVPVKYTPYLYTFLCIFRYYLTGLSFSLYCFERKHKNMLGVLVAAFTFTFCSYALFSGTKHPYFLNPMIYLPLILISVEKIFKNKSPLYLTFIVCISAVSNFYFFYVVVIATVVYVTLRLFEIYKKDIRSMIAPLSKIAVSSVLGVLLGAIIFLPSMLKLLSDSRMGVSYDYSLLYELSYYLKLPSLLISHSNIDDWTYMGYSIIILFSVATLFTAKKKHTFLKVFFLIGLGGYLTPVFAGFANGFSYPSNRWGFVFSLIVAYVISATWEELFQTENKRRLIIVSVTPVIYTALCFLSDYTVKSRIIVSTVSVVVISAGLLVYGFAFSNKRRALLLLKSAIAVFCVACIITNGYFASAKSLKKYYSVDYINNHVGSDIVNVKKAAEADGENGFYRFSGNRLSRNGNVRFDMNSTQYYWSLSDENISELHRSININESFYQLYTGFDGIASLNTLASVKYYYIDSQKRASAVPYGFTETSTENVYVNENTLPLGYTYDGYITRAEYDALESSLDKQQALLQSVVLEEGDSFVNKAQPEYVTNKLNKKLIIKDENVTYKNKTFIVTEDNAKVFFKIEKQDNSELYISFKDISFIGTSNYVVYSDEESVDPDNFYVTDDIEKLDEPEQEYIKKAKENSVYRPIVSLYAGVISDEKKIVSGKRVHYLTPDFSFYCGKNDFDANLGYIEEGCEYVVLRFPYAGVYSFSDISFYAQSMELYDESVKALSNETLQNVNVETDKVTGNITVSSDKLLCLSIPYSNAWKAFVDGEETEILKANIMYMALELSEGEHEIELVYSNPHTKVGAVITIFAAILTIAYGMWYYGRRKKNLIEFKEID